MKIRVKYAVEYVATFDVDDCESNEEIYETAGGIDIPEGGCEDSEYVGHSFRILKVINDATNEEIIL